MVAWQQCYLESFLQSGNLKISAEGCWKNIQKINYTFRKYVRLPENVQTQILPKNTSDFRIICQTFGRICLCFVVVCVEFNYRTIIFCASSYIWLVVFVWEVCDYQLTVCVSGVDSTFSVRLRLYRTQPYNSNTSKYKSKCLHIQKIHGYYPESFLLSDHTTWKVQDFCSPDTDVHVEVVPT